MANSQLSYEELRALVLEYLKKSKETQILNILWGVDALALQKGFYSTSPTYYSSTSGEHKIPKEDREDVRLIINEFLIEGILSWGINESNPNPPFLKVTRYGEECLKYNQPQPYDPEGYLKYLKTEIPNLDNTIYVYMAESLNAYLKGLMLSSTVMLGCASEKAFLLLKENFLLSISDDIKRKSIENKMSWGIKKQFEEFRIHLKQIKSNLPKDMSDDLDIQLDGVFNFIRNCRNDVGHPSGRNIEKSLAFNNLRLFVPYCKRIYELIEYFKDNPTTI
ncbi:MAG: hypothetical protein WC758_01570 [Candidatus Woesearchaeota archaeon]|jgi:hypothetical protein